MLRDDNIDSSGEDIIQEYKNLLATRVKKTEADLEEREQQQAGPYTVSH